MKQNWFWRFERKFGKYAISGLMKYVVAIEILGAVLGILYPSLYTDWLSLDFRAIFGGQVWRLVTFVLYPALIGINTGDILFFAIQLYICYSFGISLEASWGAFRFNCYYFMGLLMSVLAGFIFFIFTLPLGGIPWYVGFEYIDLSLVLAFILMYPNAQIMLMFLIPVKAKYIGIFYTIFLGLDILESLQFGIIGVGIALAVVVSMLNVVIFYFVSKNPKQQVKQMKRKRDFNKQMGQRVVPIYRHRCVICGRTERDNENLEFRYCSKCDGNFEYCSDHIYTHEHIKNHSE